ncbi:hypothetical protein PMI42_00675 [Bradyrhizobium sp. YR681]|uniref:hypothetical protein n=1 Tax=Bradyrhizobium sp. YR681 TaxID=1144344 RepID=UPI000270DEBB|nr:hypothetical protein [Bradyrhizobium sp. YR681]EJN15658.1 hypothetical protein PMI42_00675 [Bradyrhizobium sp. YR681]
MGTLVPFAALTVMDTIEKIMQAYGMMVNLTQDQTTDARQRLKVFLAGKPEDTPKLTIEGLKFLRGERVSRTRRARSPV